MPQRWQANGNEDYCAENPERFHAAGRYERYHNAFIERVMRDSPELTTFMLRKGDFMVWSSTTPHLSLPAKF